MKKLLVKSVLVVSFSLISFGLFADPPGMPGGHGSNGDQPPGGGAPIGGGALILTGLAVGYAITMKKVKYTIVEEEN